MRSSYGPIWRHHVLEEYPYRLWLSRNMKTGVLLSVSLHNRGQEVYSGRSRGNAGIWNAPA